MAKEYLVVTAVGPDRRGIVEKITDVVHRYRANIEESRMARLGGEFAVIMLVSVPGEQEEAFVEGLGTLKADPLTEQLTIFTRPTNLSRLEKFKGFVPYEISVVGADHEGIVHYVARYLAEERVQIESMETRTYPAPVSGVPIFSMQALIQAPPELTLPVLRHKLGELADELGVDIEVKVPTG